MQIRVIASLFRDLLPPQLQNPNPKMNLEPDFPEILKDPD